MADRVVKILLKGDISDFTSKMRQAGASAKATLGRELDSITKDKRAAFDDLGRSAGKVGLAAAAGFATVVGSAANFDQAMSRVAATGEDARQNMEALRAAAIQAGADTAFSASEAAQGIEELAKAGVSATDALGGGLQGALDLAAAGTISVSDAAETAATAMTQFGLSGEQVPHIADLLAAAAGKAQGGVSDMAFALKQSGLVANQVGLSIEETTGALAAFASQGLLGSDAGTSFKQMLGALTPNSAKAAKTMKELGLTAFDASGHFVGLTEFAGRLQFALKDYTDEARQAKLETIFGSDAVRAAAVIYDEGAAGVRKWIDNVDDSGFAAETAATKLDNLKGDLEQLRGSLETALIGAGEGSQSILRSIVQDVTGAVNAFNSLPGPIKNVGTAMLAVTAITGGGLWFGSKVLGGILDTRRSLNDLGLSVDSVRTKTRDLATGGLTAVTNQAKAAGEAFSEMSAKQTALRGGAAVFGILALQLNHLDESSDRATKTMGAFANVAGSAALGFAAGGPFGAAIGGGIAALTSLIGVFGDTDEASRLAAEGAADYADTLDDVTGAVTDLTAAHVAQRLEEQGVLEDLAKLGIGSEGFVQAILGQGDAAAEITAKLEALRDTYTGVAASDATLGTQLQNGEIDLFNRAGSVAEARDEYGDLIPILDSVAGAFSLESGALSDAADSTKRTADASGEAKDGILGMGDAADEAADDVIDLAKAFDTLSGGFLDQREAGRHVRDSLRAIKDAIKDYRKEHKGLAGAFKEGTKSGDEFAGLLDALAQDYQVQIDATATLTGSQRKTMAVYRESFDELVRQAEALGMTRHEAELYAKKLLGTPRFIKTTFGLDTSNAKKELNEFLAGVASTKVVIHADGSFSVGGSGKGRTGLAEGGAVVGPGTGSSDSIPAMLSNGEHVLTASEVSAAGGHGAIYAMRSALRGYANGGAVYASRPAPASTPAWAEQMAANGGGRGAPLVNVETLRANDMRDFERYAREKQAFASVGGEDF